MKKKYIKILKDVDIGFGGAGVQLYTALQYIQNLIDEYGEKAVLSINDYGDQIEYYREETDEEYNARIDKAAKALASKKKQLDKLQKEIAELEKSNDIAAI